MLVYSLIGRIDYCGDTLLGVFASLDDLRQSAPVAQFDPLDYSGGLWYYVSDLGQPIQWDDCQPV